MKRFFDYVMVILLLCVFSLPMFVIAVLVRLTSKGPVLYWSDVIRGSGFEI